MPARVRSIGARLPAARIHSRSLFLPGLSAKGQKYRTFEQQKVVQFPVPTIYGAVSDVARYADFLPWCTASRVLERRQADGPGGPEPGAHAAEPGASEELLTEVEVGYMGLAARFGSTVTLLRDRRVHSVSEPNEFLDSLNFTW
ncbi:hypothetical protein EMIHUDRAFT_256950, partial [Emiliania huxleyi CCMP1516]|uniref:Coenzyme Q-binding protein COQ10 START domain-containing protein n=3 Tax=Emiliania huxleyi TaxID=2903 RepID=A0A0D3IP67_EMIH1